MNHNVEIAGLCKESGLVENNSVLFTNDFDGFDVVVIDLISIVFNVIVDKGDSSADDVKAVAEDLYLGSFKLRGSEACVLHLFQQNAVTVMIAFDGVLLEVLEQTKLIMSVVVDLNKKTCHLAGYACFHILVGGATARTEKEKNESQGSADKCQDIADHTHAETEPEAEESGYKKTAADVLECVGFCKVIDAFFFLL